MKKLKLQNILNTKIIILYKEEILKAEKILNKIYDNAKKIIRAYPKRDRLKIMGILYDLNYIPQKEYSIMEISNLTGISRPTLTKIFNDGIRKIKNNIKGEK